MIKIKFVNGNAVVNGEFNCGYIGICKDREIILEYAILEIREWNIVKSHFDYDFTDDELAEYLTEYFNNFETKMQANIKQVNDNFLILVYDYLDYKNFWEVPEITNSEYLPKDMNDEDIDQFDPCNPLLELSLKIQQEYKNTPNDGSIQKTDVEKFIRENLPILNLDNFLAKIVPDYISLEDGSIIFMCSDRIDFEHKILHEATAEIDENLTFCEWHNF